MHVVAKIDVGPWNVCVCVMNGFSVTMYEICWAMSGKEEGKKAKHFLCSGR